MTTPRRAPACSPALSPSSSPAPARRASRSPSTRRPLPERVRLLPADAPVEVHREYQTFYYPWGLFPMTQSDQAKYIIEQEHLVEARVIQGGLLEGIVAGFFGTLFLGGFILSQDLTSEGNRHPTLPPIAGQAHADLTVSSEQ